MKSISLHTRRMMRYMTLCIVVVGWLMACKTPGDAPVVELSDTPIRMDIEGWNTIATNAPTRATIFDSEDDFLNDDPTAKGGGNLTLHAYFKDDGKTFIDGTRAWYFVPDGQTTGRWRFYDEPNFIEYYWPQTGKLDFLAYMPYKNSGRPTNMTLGNYDKATGLTINCDVHQPDNFEDTTGQETILAYTTNKGKEDGTVNFHFVHPFTAVKFKLKQAHRGLRINFFRFEHIYTTGTALLDGDTNSETTIRWTQTSDETTYCIPVEKTIPDDGINFGGDVGCYYLVMPQSLDKGTNATDDDVLLTINYTWDDGMDTDPTNDTKEFSTSLAQGSVKEWLSGQKYTYLLDLGDNKEEILFKVLVEPWIVTGEKNIIDIE